MKKRFSFLSLVAAIAVTAVLTFNMTYTIINVKHNKENAELFSNGNYIGALLTVEELVRANYSGDIDSAEVKAAVIRGYLEGIGDKYSTYMTADEYEAYKAEFSGNAVGIGINVVYDVNAATVEVIEVVADSPAETAGILAGDLIVAVDGERISDIGYYSALELIRGEAGSSVKITVSRDGSEYEYTCIRSAVEVVTVKHHVYSADNSVGVIRISSFYSQTPSELKNAVDELTKLGCDRFVFDLRYNGGGELGSIVKTLDYLLPEGKLTDVYYSGTGRTKTYTSDESQLDASVAVLVNGSTASAAELFAAALRDYTKDGKYDAVLVGTTTYGKGVFHTIYELSDGSAFKISCGGYTPPCGVNYDGVGVVPDVVEELSEEAKGQNFYKLTDETDNQLILAASILSSK